MPEETATLAPPARASQEVIKVIMNYPWSGFHKGDILSGTRKRFKKFLEAPVVEQGQKPIAPPARIITADGPDKQLLADVPGPASIAESIVYCGNCGLDTKGSKKFCPECGKSVNGAR